MLNTLKRNGAETLTRFVRDEVTPTNAMSSCHCKNSALVRSHVECNPFTPKRLLFQIDPEKNPVPRQNKEEERVV